MSEPAIHASGVSKHYRLGSLSARHGAIQGYNTLRDTLSESAAELLRAFTSRLGRASAPVQGETSIWALRDVSFEIQPGEVVGIIGGNGAGKSTLLKILSRVTRPTTGWVQLRGRVGSLLEVGTGFHAELTGRENIYLSGAILGMKRAEIRQKFDRIVEFAEVERFIDTPVKRYSSGMYLRLAFAVAAHLEPEILLVDEVLAVGDASFQKKCLGKMGDVAQAGRTVILVSHNMDAIRRLCAHTILLDHGHLVARGDSESVIARYLARSDSQPEPNAWIDLSAAQRVGTGEVRFHAVRYSSRNHAVGCRPYSNGLLVFDLMITSDAPRSVGSMAVTIKAQSGTKLINADIVSQGQSLELTEGPNRISLQIEELYLNPGVYVVGLWLGHSFGKALDHIEAALEIEVTHAGSRGFGMTPASDGLVPCRFRLLQAGPLEGGSGQASSSG